MATASDVMDRVAAVCLNDPNKATYTYTVQLPHLKSAWEELAQYLTANNIPVVKEVSTTLTYTAGQHNITPPSDIFIPVKLYERGVGENDNSWVPMEQKPWDVKRVMTDYSTLNMWNWREQVFEVPGCGQDREVYCEYWKDITAQIANNDSTISVNNAINALAFLTASTLAQFVGSNSERAEKLYTKYEISRDLILTIGVKKNQFQSVRRRRYRGNTRRAITKN